MTSHYQDLTVVEEIALECSEGLTIAGQRWTKKEESTDVEQRSHAKKRLRILCFHGFLDNCRTFHLLGPYLVSRLDNDAELVALDFPGHGLSSHKSLDSPPMMVINEICFHMRDACRSLQWDDEDGFILIGHSLGSIISVIYAASFPEQVQDLILLDGYGPDNYEMFEMYMKESRRPYDESSSSQKPKGIVAERLRRHIQQRYDSNVRINKMPNKRKRTYASIHTAVQARMRTAELSPGRQWISMAAALELVRRAVIVDKYPRVRFRHDPRFNLPPLHLNTIEQVDVYWSQIQAKTLWLRAMDGWPYPPAFTERAEAILGTLGNVQFLPGSHHFHADPATAEEVGRTVLEYVLSSRGCKS